TVTEPIPAPRTEFEHDLFDALTVLFLAPLAPGHVREAVRSAVGETNLEFLLGFMAFIRAAHYWTETHSDLTYEADMLTLMERHPELGELLLDPAEAEQTRGAIERARVIATLGCPAGYPRNVCRSRAAPKAHQTPPHPDRQTRPRSQARQSSTTRLNARSGPLRTDPSDQDLQHRRNLSACRCRPGLHHPAVQLGLASIRPPQAPRQRPCRKAAPLSPLPAAGRGIFRLPDLLEALRARLCSLDCRSPAPGPR